VFSIYKIDNCHEKSAMKVYNFNSYDKSKQDRMKMIFKMEIDVLKVLANEKGVVNIQNYGEHEGYGFIIMELLEG